MIIRDERRFRVADKNRDMVADKQEFTAFLHPEDQEHMKDIVVQVSIMSLMSCDFTDVMLCHCHLVSLMSCACSLSQETMEDIDKNGDGFIDLQEYIGKKFSQKLSEV